MRRPGLRTRVTAAFAAGALLLSASMAVLSYELTRNTLLAGRERAAVRAANLDAATVRTRLGVPAPDVLEVLRSLDTGGSRRAVIWRAGEWYARTADSGVTDAIPASLQRLVSAGRTGVQRVRTPAGPALAIGIPVAPATGFYVVDSLAELDQTLRVLSLILTLVATGTTAAGAGLGWYATKRALLPLASVARAAREISGGDLTARLDPATEPDLARLTSSFNEMVDQLGRRLERDRRFAADVSHELRSPLQTLAAAATVLANQQNRLDPRTATAVALLTHEVGRFQQLVTDLLELARGDQPPERVPVDMARLARQVCVTHGVPPDIVRAEDDCDVTWHVDRRRFAQVLANLLDNAGRHGGGPLSVRLGATADVRFLEVDDDGPGVRPADRAAIFDRFYRGRAGARGDSGGTGLGLALVSQHVQAHGGRVSVMDRPGGGARFRVELPEEGP